MYIKKESMFKKYIVWHCEL